MPQEYRLPDGSIIDVPDDASPEERAKIARAIREQFGAPSPQPQSRALAPSLSAMADLDAWIEQQYGTQSEAGGGSGAPSLSAMADLDAWMEEQYGTPAQVGGEGRAPASSGGIASLQPPPPGSPEEPPPEGGTKLGAAWEGIKALPKGIAQAGLMVGQGAVALATPHKDIQLEKDIRGGLRSLQESVDPRYRDSNLVHVGMGLGQYGGMIGLGFLPGGASLALGGMMTMHAGDAAGRIADYEERTGEDVGTGKEMLSLGMGLGIGIGEMMPVAKFIPKGLASKGIAKVTQEAAESAAMMTGKQFRASLLPTTIRQAREEALQEGLAAYGHSAVAKLVYDEDALANAGSEALREALIGGQVGAVGNILLRMTSRAYGRGAMRYGNYRAGLESVAALDRAAESRVFDGDYINDLVSGRDLEGIRQDLIERGVNPELVEEHEEFLDAQGVERVRAALEVDPDGRDRLMEAHAAQAQAAKDENEQYKDSDPERYKKERKRIDDEDVAFRRQVGSLQAAIRITNADRLERARIAGLSKEELAEEERVRAEEEREGDPEAVLTEKDIGEIDSEDEVIKARQIEIANELQRVRNLESVEGGDSRSAQLALQAESEGLGRLLEQNKETRERLTPKPLKPPVLSNFAENLTYAWGNVALQLQLALRPKQKDVEAQAQAEINSQAGEVGRRIEALKSPLRDARDQLKALEKGLTRTQKNRLKQLEIDRENSNAAMVEQAASGVTEAQLQDSPDQLEQFRLNQEESAKIDRQIEALDIDRLREAQVAKIKRAELEIASLEDGPVVLGTREVENVQGNIVPRTVVLSGAKELASPEYQAERKADAIKTWKGGESLGQLKGKLVTQAQRENLDAFLARPETDEMTAQEVEETIDGILGGGLHVAYESTGRGPRGKEGFAGTPVEGMPLVRDDGGFYYPVLEARAASEQEVDNARAEAKEATNEILSWWSQVGISRDLAEKGTDVEVVKNSPLGILRPRKLKKLAENLRKNGYRVTKEILVEAFQAKNFGIEGDLFESKVFQELVTDTLGRTTPMRMNAKVWNQLGRGQQEAVLARIVRTKAARNTTKKGLAEQVYRRDIKRLQDAPGAIVKTEKQKQLDEANLVEARDRFDTFSETARRLLAAAGLGRLAVQFTADANDVMAQVEDVVINGAYEIETDADGNAKVDENGDPVHVKDANGKKVFRQPYKDGKVVALEKHGMRIVFNLSQIVGQNPAGIDAAVETFLKDAVAHEGAHLLFLNGSLTSAEQASLEAYGRNKKNKVPKEVDVEAHEAGLTWREWIAEMYQDKTEAEITEETSVRILDSLATGKIAEDQSAGVIGKIKRESVAVFKAMVGASQDGDILPVMRIFQDIKSGAIARRREEVAAAEGLKGIRGLQLIKHAKPSDVKRLKEAIKLGDRAEIDKIADEIVRSREEFAATDERTDEERLIESLASELRARQEIDETPDFISSVLNAKAIEDGDIDVDALNAYFRFRDGRKPVYRMPVGDREWRWGRTPQVRLNEEAQKVVDGDLEAGRIGSSTGHIGKQSIEAGDAHNRLGDKYTGTVEEFRDMMETTIGQRFRIAFLDKRFPMWKSEKRGFKKQIIEYEKVLSRLAESSAGSAWRFADNAMNFIPGVMKHGMIVYEDGGFKMKKLVALDREGDPRRDSEGNEIPVKGLYEIFGTLAQMGADAETYALGYMARRRVVDTHAEMLRAKENLEVLKDEKAPAKDIATASRLADEWEAGYDDANPRMKGGEDNTGREWSIAKSEEFIKKVEGSTDELNRATFQFGEEYADFNYQLIQFGIDTGLIAKDNGEIMQRLAYVPFYRDVGWENVDPMFNGEQPDAGKRSDPKSREARSSEDEGAWQDLPNETDEFRQKSQPLITRQIRGSLKPIRNDLFGNIQRNVQAIIRDGMTNIAVTRTMRDELAAGGAGPTAVLLIEHSQEDLRRWEVLKDKKNKTKAEKSELAALKKKMDATQKKAKEQKTELDRANFSSIMVTAMGVSTQLDRTAEGGTTRIEEAGVPKTYRLLDPELSRAVMSVGFSPKQSIENFFGKHVKSERVAKGLTTLIVGPSTFLREMVVRSPPFIAKNIIRDSWQASVVYGGGPSMFFKAMKNFVKPNILKEAEERGLGIAVDWQADPNDPVSVGVRQHLKKKNRGNLSSPSAWANPLDWLVNMWDVLGDWGKRSEVATRMAIYDHTLAKTGNGNPAEGNSAEALKQAIEIINYGRRGASPMFGLITAMAPFLNGRVQGLDVTFRTHVGSMDAPGLFGEEGITDVDSVGDRARRTATAVSRGSFIALGTLMYYLMVKDDDEYKNTREDLKNDWWLIPLPGTEGVHIKIPIPFEIGTLYKVIPEQIARMMFEDEHDIRDVRDELRRQISGSLMLDLRPQVVRPMLDAWSNKDAYQRDAIVPQWMEDTVMGSEQYNAYTSLVTRLIGDKMGDVPFLKNVGFLNSPMKLEYMLRQYTGTIGSYVLLTADATTRWAMDENKVGTSADFGLKFDWRTIANMPMIGDLLYDAQKGGGYQEDFYEAVEDINTLVSTLGQIEERRGSAEGQEFEEKHKGLFDAKRRLQYFERRMKHYREERNRLMERTDLSDDDKRRQLFRMFEIRDDMLEEMVGIMGEIRDERGFMEAALGTRP